MLNLKELLMCNLANFLSLMYVLLEVINTNCIKTKCVVRAVHLFSERLVNVWNSLPDSTDFSTFPRFIGALFYESVLPNFLNVFVS